MLDRRRGALSIFPGEARKVLQYRRNEISVAAVLRRQTGGIQIQDIARLGDGLRPGRGGNRQQLVFNNGLPIAQIPCVLFNLSQRATKVGCLLSSHAAVLVEIERFVSHRACLRRSAAHPTDRPSRSIFSPSQGVWPPQARRSWSQCGGTPRTKVLRSSPRR